MALIYANAVNKRMNQTTATRKASRKKSECSAPCPHRESSESPVRSAASRESINGAAPIRKKSSPAYVTTSCQCGRISNSGGLGAALGVGGCGTGAPSTLTPQSPAIHKPVQRSKTASGDLVKKAATGDVVLRKVSQPVMSSSLTSTALHKENGGPTTGGPSPQRSMRSDLRKFLARRSLIQKYDLEEKCDAPPGGSPLNEASRRKSISLDGDEWRRKIDEAVESETGLRGGNGENARPGTFQRMRNKFNKWKFSRD